MCTINISLGNAAAICNLYLTCNPNLSHQQGRIYLHIVKTSVSESYHDLYKWSVEKYAQFWEELWHYSNLKYSKVYTQVSILGGAVWHFVQFEELGCHFLL